MKQQVTNPNQVIILICKRVLFYSTIDEDLFFEWMQRIPVIVDLKGVHDEIHLYIKNTNLEYNDLLEIVGLFDRYKIDMKQLKVFLNDTNKDWLEELVT